MPTLIILTLLTIGSMYLAGRMALARGHSVTAWYWLAAFIGRFALPLVFLVPRSRHQARI
jgi:hypothetical protein